MKRIPYLLVLLAAIVGLTMFIRSMTAGFAPTNDTFTFERDVRANYGSALDPETLVSKEGVRLADIFSVSSGTFTDERFRRYGADTNMPDGVGLRIAFEQKGDQNAARPIDFEIPAWQTPEEDGGNEVRRNLVESKQPELAKMIAAFAAPVRLNWAFGVALDTTEGIDESLAERVREVISDTGADRLAKEGQKVTLNFYHITRTSYQGGRRQVNFAAPNGYSEAEKWLLETRKEERNSSVLRGLVSVLGEMAEYADQHPRLDVFTDGLENTLEVSVYRNPGLLDKTEPLDKVFNLLDLKLQGMEIHLHPLPAKSEPYEALMRKALNYIATRLQTAGAKVKVDPF